eukprot:g3924.t1
MSKVDPYSDMIERLKMLLKAELRSVLFSDSTVVIMKEKTNSNTLADLSDSSLGTTLCGPQLRARKGWFRVDTSEKQTALLDCIKCIWKISSDSEEAWSLIATSMKDDLLVQLLPEHFIDWSLFPVLRVSVKGGCSRNLVDSKVTLISEESLFMSRTHRPETYIQFAGKAILEQFSMKLGGLFSLPESVPFHVLEILCLNPFRRGLECILMKKAELSAFYPFIQVQSSVRKFTPLRRRHSKDYGINRSNGTVVKKSVYGMVLNIHKDSLDFLKGVSFLFTDREIPLSPKYEKLLYSGILDVWKKHANDLGRLLIKESQKAIRKLSRAFLKNKDLSPSEITADCWSLVQSDHPMRDSETERPKKMSSSLCQLVESLPGYLSRSRKLPEPLKPFPCLIAIECVDSIFSLYEEIAKEIASFKPSKAYSIINALLCIKRRFILIQDVYDISPKSEFVLKVIQDASERVVKAEELLIQLKEYTIEMHVYRISRTCLQPSIQENWHSLRPSDARHDISPFLKFWNMQLTTIHKETSEYLSSHLQRYIFEKVLSETLRHLCVAYMQLNPSKPLLEDFALDVAYIISSVFQFYEQESVLAKLSTEIHDCCKALASHVSMVSGNESLAEWNWIKE